MDGIARSMGQVRWKWATKDLRALRELERRLAATGGRGETITYSDLAVGVEFNIPTLNGGAPYQIDVRDWKDLDRALIGDFLGYISARSYVKWGFMASALAVEKDERRPSGQFFAYMRDIGAFTGATDDARLEFWVDQVKRACDHYQSTRPKA